MDLILMSSLSLYQVKSKRLVMTFRTNKKRLLKWSNSWGDIKLWSTSREKSSLRFRRLRRPGSTRFLGKETAWTQTCLVKLSKIIMCPWSFAPLFSAIPWMNCTTVCMMSLWYPPSEPWCSQASSLMLPKRPWITLRSKTRRKWTGWSKSIWISKTKNCKWICFKMRLRDSKKRLKRMIY